LRSEKPTIRGVLVFMSIAGISATAFPSGIQGVPAEIIENVSPLVMEKRALVTDSGGPGKFRFRF
jgi:N-methylhydantoinase B/oxoprolinase/acetone carboxylase alpha subunit